MDVDVNLNMNATLDVVVNQASSGLGRGFGLVELVGPTKDRQAQR
jgi:hypothetical protein